MCVRGHLGPGYEMACHGVCQPQEGDDEPQFERERVQPTEDDQAGQHQHGPQGVALGGHMDAVQYRIESEYAERRDAQNEQAAQDQGGGDGEAY